jgi:hypothetical protein
MGAATTATTATASIEVFDSGIRIAALDIPRKPVADYLKDTPEGELELSLINAVEVGVFCLERAAGASDLEFVRRQVEGLLAAVEQAVGHVPLSIRDELLAKLGTQDGQVLAPMQRLVDDASRTLTDRLNGVRDLLADKIDPDDRTSSLGQALGALKDLLDPRRSDSIQGCLAEAVRTVTGQDGAVARSVRETVSDAVKPLADEVSRLSQHLATEAAVDEALQSTTKKGQPYEIQVVSALQPWAAATGAAVSHVGPDNRPGDVVVEFPNNCVAGVAPTIVVEARDRSTPLGRKAIAETLAGAMAERGANAAIYLSRSLDGLAKEIGEWAEGTSERGSWVATTDEHLFIALRFLLVEHRLATVHESLPEVDRAALEAQIERIRTALKRVTNINRRVGEIRSQVGAIQDEAELLRSEIRDSLGAIEDALRHGHVELVAA